MPQLSKVSIVGKVGKVLKKSQRSPNKVPKKSQRSPKEVPKEVPKCPNKVPKKSKRSPNKVPTKSQQTLFSCSRRSCWLLRSIFALSIFWVTLWKNSEVIGSSAPTLEVTTWRTEAGRRTWSGTSCFKRAYTKGWEER